jgi:hypothetical protein
LRHIACDDDKLCVGILGRDGLNALAVFKAVTDDDIEFLIGEVAQRGLLFGGGLCPTDV